MRFPESSDQKFDEFVERHRKAVPPRHPVPPQPTWAAPPWQESEENRTPEVERIAWALAEFVVIVIAAAFAAVAISAYLRGNL
jgi:hypothetical protein